MCTPKVKAKNWIKTMAQQTGYVLTVLLLSLTLVSQASTESFLDEFNSSPTRHSHQAHNYRHLQHQHQHSLQLQQQSDGDHRRSQDNFILIDYLSDGERERRISWNGIAGKETSLGDSSKTLSLWQMVTGKAFIQLIYTSDGQLMDCEYLRQKKFITEFRNRFFGEIEQARARNFTSPFPASARHSLVSDHDFREFLENGILTSEMEDLQYSVQEFASNSGESAAQPVSVDAFGLRNLTYIPLVSEADIPKDLLKQLNYKRLKHMCDERHRQLRAVAHGLQSGEPAQKQAAEETLQRHKRAIADWFLSPNTKWCGRGRSAEHYNQLGGASRADMCCRKHDHCKLHIPSMTTKWDLFNFRPYTISHCSCDQRFRTCLKMADSSDANMVGKLFFNIVQSKCFVLKPETVCKKRSWWDKCEKKVRRKRAHIRDNRKF